MRSLRALLSLFGLGIGLLATVVLELFSSAPSRSDYAFVVGRSTPTVLSFTETPLVFVVGVPILCALVGWVTALVLTRRGWAIGRAERV